MPFRLFYCPAGWDYPQLLWSHKPWVVAEWQTHNERRAMVWVGQFLHGQPCPCQIAIATKSEAQTTTTRRTNPNDHTQRNHRRRHT